MILKIIINTRGLIRYVFLINHVFSDLTIY